MRFRLKSPFLDHAHNQIRGGVWYKPSWWDAVSRVPPVHFQPRINKQEVPRIHFLEDRLLRRFEARNPAITAFDTPAGAAASAAAATNVPQTPFASAQTPPAAPPTVAAQFVAKQLAAMARGADEDAAYALARAWMLDNGPSLFAQLDVPARVRATVMQTPESVGAARVAADRALAEQLAQVREALAAVAAASRDPAAARGAAATRAADADAAAAIAAALAASAASASRGGQRRRGERSAAAKAPVPPYRSFRSADEDAAIGARARGSEARYAHGEGGASTSVSGAGLAALARGAFVSDVARSGEEGAGGEGGSADGEEDAAAAFSRRVSQGVGVAPAAPVPAAATRR